MSTDTWNDLARSVMPCATDEECQSLLWECSSFPFDTPDGTLRVMQETWEAGGRTLAGAVAYSYAKLDRCMEEANKERDAQEKLEAKG